MMYTTTFPRNWRIFKFFQVCVGEAKSYEDNLIKVQAAPLWSFLPGLIHKKNGLRPILLIMMVINVVTSAPLYATLRLDNSEEKSSQPFSCTKNRCWDINDQTNANPSRCRGLARSGGRSLRLLHYSRLAATKNAFISSTMHPTEIPSKTFLFRISWATNLTQFRNVFLRSCRYARAHRFRYARWHLNLSKCNIRGEVSLDVQRARNFRGQPTWETKYWLVI